MRDIDFRKYKTWKISITKIETWKFRHVAPPLSNNVTDINCLVLRYADVLMIYGRNKPPTKIKTS